MERRILVVGDPPVLGGQVLPYDGPMFDLYGHRVALIGGRAYCQGCNSVGIIAKTGGPRRPQFISEAALEGDVVVCHCPVPQPVLSTLQQTATCDDGARHAVGTTPIAATMAMAETIASAEEMAALKKAVDESVTHPPEAEETEKICPNMTNKEFCTLVLKLRDRAAMLITKRRLPELERWDKSAQGRVKEWFGVADQPMRDYLQKGLIACRRVLEGLGCANFVRYSDITKRNLGCIFPNQTSSTIAAVCKPDIATRTIAIALAFCELREFSTESDSQLLTLVHEVTHFDDCFGSFDTIYKMKESLKAVGSRSSEVKANADNLAGYVVWGESYEG